MKVHLYDFRYLDEKACEFQASFGGEKFARKKIQIGEDLSLQIESDIRCAGSVREGVWKKCPDGITGKKRCERCRAREGNFIFTAFDGFNTENFTSEDLSHLSGPHLVYLALFSKELIKVGVCKKERKILRQIEQGSHATLFFAETPDGILARQLETTLRNFGLADKIKASSKKNFITPEISQEEAQKSLQETLDKFIPSLERTPNLQSFLTDPEFMDWSEIYGLQNIIDSPKSFHSVSLKNEELVSGKFIAKKGSFIVLETPDELVSLCAKDLVGRDIEFDPIPPGLHMKAALQGALF